MNELTSEQEFHCGTPIAFRRSAFQAHIPERIIKPTIDHPATADR